MIYRNSITSSHADLLYAIDAHCMPRVADSLYLFISYLGAMKYFHYFALMFYFIQRVLHFECHFVCVSWDLCVARLSARPLCIYCVLNVICEVLLLRK